MGRPPLTVAGLLLFYACAVGASVQSMPFQATNPSAYAPALYGQQAFLQAPVSYYNQPSQQRQVWQAQQYQQAPQAQRYQQAPQAQQFLQTPQAQQYQQLQQSQQAYYAQPPATVPPTPAPTTPPACPSSCPTSCYPDCHAQCCDPKPPPRALYLKRAEKTATACEGHKLKLECPNKYDRIILYSTFYGRKDNKTCQHDVIPSKGYCAQQEMRVNEKVFDLCGHERRCLVSAHNRFLAKSNTTICPGLYKYLQVTYRCSQHPRLYTHCPLPCKNPQKCFPRCTADCCSPKTCPANCPAHCYPSCDKRCCTPPAPPPPPPPARCPAACPSYCTPPCTAECCYGQLQQQQMLEFQKKVQQQQAMYNMQLRQQQEANLAARRSRIAHPMQQSIPGYQNYQRSSFPQTSYNNYARTVNSCPGFCRMYCATGCPPQCCA
ncbi:mediator of RNA polymerase II transcription subunit 15-like [Nematostella vectensis]|uniref:mediator of RNA polymerase II transcription subunit 15-like n=1 Tax=Nematostella vectensis TaxID=45351 RepID=UPI002076F5B9|nr:mediator of RNA polymerase II transcription subunit 15-like [Nematostella vectensis]